MLKTLNYYGKALQLRKQASENVKKPSRGAAVDGVHSAARILLQSVGGSCGGGERLAKSTPPLAAVGLLFEAEGKKKEQMCIHVIT